MIRTLASFRFYLVTRGVRATLILSIKHPYFVAQNAISYHRGRRKRVQRIRAERRQFDERFGVETHSTATLAEMGVASPNPQGRKYDAVPQEFFTPAMASLDIHHQDFVFVHLGSGKGKALLLASEYPFRRIIGVEYSPVMHRIAVENFARYRSPTQRCRNIESICQDAAGFEFPLSPLVVYLCNPFWPELFGRVLDRLESSLASHPRPCMLVMVYDHWQRVMRERGNVVEYANGEFFATLRHRADVFAKTATA